MTRQALGTARTGPRMDPVLCALAALTALGTALRFLGIGHQGFWYDESYTAFLVHYDSPGRMLGLLPHLESTPPLYYCVAWVWARIFGDGPAGLKSLSAVCGVLVIPVVFYAARKLLDSPRAALIAAALTACSPLLIWYSQEARAYELLVLLCAGTLLTFAHVRETPDARAAAAWAVVSALALATHYYAALLVIPEAAWLLYRHRRVRAVQAGIALVVAVGLALLPLLIAQSHTGNDSWIASTPLLERLGQIIPLFLIGPVTHLRELVKYLAYAAALAGLLALAWRLRRGGPRSALVPGALALAGFLIAVTAGETTLLARNLLPIWVPLAIMVAAGLGVRRTGAAALGARRTWAAGIVGIGATALLCAIGIFATVSVATDYWLERPNWQVLTRALGPWPPSAASRRSPVGASGARVIVVPDNPAAMPLSLYLPGLRYARSNTLADVTAIDIIRVRYHPGLSGFCWWGSACNLIPTRLHRNYAPPGFHRVGILRVEQFDVLELAASRPRRVAVSALPPSGADTHERMIVDGRAVTAGAPLIQRG